MNVFYDVIVSIMIRGMLVCVITTMILVCVLALIQFHDVKKYHPRSKPTKIASIVAVYFYMFAFLISAIGKLDNVIIDEACPVAKDILIDGASSLELIQKKTIVNICGVKFFEMHSGTKWNISDE